jgi:hypothetical protein
MHARFLRLVLLGLLMLGMGCSGPAPPAPPAPGEQAPVEQPRKFKGRIPPQKDVKPPP